MSTKPMIGSTWGGGRCIKSLSFVTLANKLCSGRGTEQSHPRWVKYPICSREYSKIEAFEYGLLSVRTVEASHSAAGLFNTFKCNCNF